MQAKYIPGNSVKIIKEDWGTLQWLVNAKNNTSSTMTVGRVTFKPGMSNPFHHHPNCNEVLYVVSGTIEHTLDSGRKTKMSPGDVIVIPGGLKHSARNTGDKEAVVVVSFDNADRITIGE